MAPAQKTSEMGADVDGIKQAEAYTSAPKEQVVDDEDYSRAYCDGKGCGIAKVRALFVSALPDGGVLCWCLHHTNIHRRALEEQGALIVELTPA